MKAMSLLKHAARFGEALGSVIVERARRQFAHSRRTALRAGEEVHASGTADPDTLDQRQDL